MTEPRIQYAKTSDGMSIAYWVLGHGTPYVMVMPPPFSHIRLEWEFPELREAYTNMAERRKVIRYDGRGSGLSSREVDDFSLDAHLVDLATIVESLGLEDIALQGFGDAGVVAMAFAASRPELISHLVLGGTYARPTLSTEMTGLREVVDRDWELFTETMARAASGWSSGEAGERLASLLRECTTPEAVAAAWDASLEFDVTGVLSDIKARTLILHPQRLRWVTEQDAIELASKIPHAELIVIDDYLGFGAFSSTLRDAVARFLGDGDDVAATRQPEATPSDQSMTAILFADIADSTALTERMGDAAFRDQARRLDAELRQTIREAGGTPIEGKLLGDGVLATFGSARQAIAAALACGRAGDEGGLPLHVGLHAGDVIAEDGNVFGGAVNIAARISGESAPGEVLVSQTMRELARTSAGVTFEDCGERVLKGVGEPIRVWRVLRQAQDERIVR